MLPVPEIGPETRIVPGAVGKTKFNWPPRTMLLSIVADGLIVANVTGVAVVVMTPSPSAPSAKSIRPRLNSNPPEKSLLPFVRVSVALPSLLS